MSGKPFVPSENIQTWETISNRFNKFTPSIELAEYVDFEADNAIQVLKYPSDGIHFVLAKQHRDKFLEILRQARTKSGRRAFEEGRWKGKLHAAKGAALDLIDSVTGGASSSTTFALARNGSWAANISFKATKGIGFREIWYLELPERQLRLQNVRNNKSPQLDFKFSALFDAPNTSSIDLSSLHWAVEDPDPKTGRSKCNIHIDQVGVAADLGNGVAITPDVVYHTLVELAFRTGLKGRFRDEVLQAVDFIMPSSHENYALNFGIQINMINRKDMRFSLRGMCSVHNSGCEWSGTANLRGFHNLLGSQ
jgi:hypothetical protein